MTTPNTQPEQEMIKVCIGVIVTSGGQWFSDGDHHGDGCERRVRNLLRTLAANYDETATLHEVTVYIPRPRKQYPATLEVAAESVEVADG
jgi:hypothetical protein